MALASADPLGDGDPGLVLPPRRWPAAVAARYELIRRTGQGHFGDVYLAWDRVDKRLVAVKRLAGRTDRVFIRTGLRELAREAMSLGACRGHPSVVELLATYADSRHADGDCFVVTAFAGRMNLRRYMALRQREGRPFHEAEVRDVMQQLLAGVGRAHAAGILHRAIEPANVVVDEGTTEKKKKVAYRICGFGMSEPAAQAGKDGFSQVAAPTSYRAPELFLGSKEYDGRVDTWALGCIMAELLAGTGGNPLFGSNQSASEAFWNTLNLVGAEGLRDWPGLQRLPETACDPATVAALSDFADAGVLREMFTAKMLSEEGFDVLSGLLESNPERRLTVEAALKMPWFWFRPRWRSRFTACVKA
ncbi:hypothetical protein ACP4OV_007701 [Aristida adscensionis]